ncbi:MAG TPA: PAS domain-containing sensor histidine kinase [Dehalococcoidia bacterium]|nr:PAS domain-containing sensor histidine kinase [Dehalococcoidia bacterium]
MADDERGSAGSGTPARPGRMGLDIGAIVSRIAEAVIVVRAADGCIVFWNRAAETIFGYAAAEAVGRSVELIVPPGYLEQHRAGLQRFAGGSNGALVDSGRVRELPAIHRSGAELRIELSLSRIGDDGGYALAIIRDVTERSRVEREHARLLAEQAARAEAEAAAHREALLAEASVILASSLDYEVTVSRVAQLVVPRLADWCFFDLEDDVGAVQRVAVACADPERADLARALRAFPPLDDRTAGVPLTLHSGEPQLVPAVEERFLERAARSEEHLRLLRLVGVRSFIFVPLIARGRTLGVLSLATAESGRVYGQNDLSLAGALARRVALGVDNARLYREAERAIHVRDEFLASASHELRTPVTAIRAYAQVLLRRAERNRAQAGDETVEALQRIDEATSRLSAQIGQLLDLARLQNGRQLELDLRLTDLVALLRQCVAVQQHLTALHRLGFESDRARLPCRADTLRLERAIGGVLANAVKYSPGGSPITVSLAAEPVAGGFEAIIRVTDAGMGIPAADLPHVFERFYRGSNVRGVIAGTGVGLAAAQEIVAQHGGRIAIQSELDRGTEVTIRIPCEPGDRFGRKPARHTPRPLRRVHTAR